MTHAVPFVAAVAVLTAFAAGAPVQAQTPEIDALRARAEAGVAVAQYDLGVMHANGLGVPEDDAEAMRWYRLAADQGHADAQVNLASMYFTGQRGEWEQRETFHGVLSVSNVFRARPKRRGQTR